MKKKVKPYIYLLIFLGISFLLVRYTPAEDLSVFSTVSLFAYFGVLIGFALTGYTFTLSMIGDIKRNIDSLDDVTDEKKEKLYDSLIYSFSQVEQDIWLIFYSMILVIIISFLKNIENPFGWDVERWQLPEVINLFTFITTTFIMYDIITNMFATAKINMLLLKKNKPS